MSIVVTICGEDAITVVSDMRVTWPDGKVLSDNRPKHIFIVAEDGYFILGTTGIAFVGQKPTHEWIADHFSNERFIRATVQDLHEELVSMSQQAIGSGSTYNCFEFITVGFRCGIPFLRFVTNFEVGTGGQISYRKPEIFHFAKHPTITVRGTLAAIDPDTSRFIRKLLGFQIHEQHHNGAAMRAGVRIINRISREPNPSSRKPSPGVYVGRDCMASSIFKDQPAHIVTMNVLTKDFKDCPSPAAIRAGRGWVMQRGSSEQNSNFLRSDYCLHEFPTPGVLDSKLASHANQSYQLTKYEFPELDVNGKSGADADIAIKVKSRCLTTGEERRFRLSKGKNSELIKKDEEIE